MEKKQIRDILYEVEMLRRRLLQPYFVAIGLTLGQGQPRILYVLLCRGAMTQRELAEACKLDATTMSRTLDRLEENGFLYRRPGDRRTNLIELTLVGKEKALQVENGFAAVDDLLWQELNEQEAASLLTIMEKVKRSLAGCDEIKP